ncbi:MAG: adenylate kinase [Bacteroidetes bacterium]|jgi:adenylate kinase|nr:adenylate kinase [Bacteroidota bacterium]
MLNLIIFGPPGAGKGTQSEKIIERYQLAHISTGDLLRAERNAGTELGNKANEFISKGELVPDEVVIGMVRNFMVSKSGVQGFIFDGFPRTIPQAEALDAMLMEFDTAISTVLGLEVVEDELVKRLMLRGQTSGRVDDQDEDTIRNRFREYQNKTLPLKDYYANQKKYQSVQGIGEIDEIFTNLCACIDAV